MVPLSDCGVPSEGLPLFEGFLALSCVVGDAFSDYPIRFIEWGLWLRRVCLLDVFPCFVYICRCPELPRSSDSFVLCSLGMAEVVAKLA